MRRTILVALVAALVLGAVLYRVRREGSGLRPGGYSEADSLLSFKVAILYFGGPNGDSLVGESREMPPDSVNVRGLLGALVQGSLHGAVRLLPRGTRLLGSFEVDRSTVYLDFSRELAELELGGFSPERLAIASILKTLDANLDGIERVCFLVDGEPITSLSGHLDISGCLDCGAWREIVPRRQGDEKPGGE